MAANMCHLQNAAIAHVLLARMPSVDGATGPSRDVRSALCSYLGHLLQADPRLGATLLRQHAVQHALVPDFLHALLPGQRAETLQLCCGKLAALLPEPANAPVGTTVQTGTGATALRDGGDDVIDPGADAAGKEGLFWVHLGLMATRSQRHARAANKAATESESQGGPGDAAGATPLHTLVMGAAAELMQWPELAHAVEQLCGVIRVCASRDLESWAAAVGTLRRERTRQRGWAAMRVPIGGNCALKRGFDEMAAAAPSALQKLREHETRLLRCAVCE